MMRFAVLALLPLRAAASDAGASGKRNMRTVSKLFEIERYLLNKTLSSELMQEFQGKLVSYYAPTLKRCAVTPSSSIGFDLRDSSVSECFEADARAFSGCIPARFAVELGAVQGSEGKQIFAWGSPWDCTCPGMGEEVKGWSANVFEFSDDGLIVGGEFLIDTSTIPGVTSLAELAPPSTSAAGTAVLVAASFSMGAVAMAAFARLTQRKPEAPYAPLADC